MRGALGDGSGQPDSGYGLGAGVGQHPRCREACCRRLRVQWRCHPRQHSPSTPATPLRRTSLRRHALQQPTALSWKSSQMKLNSLEVALVSSTRMERQRWPTRRRYLRRQKWASRAARRTHHWETKTGSCHRHWPQDGRARRARSWATRARAWSKTHGDQMADPLTHVMNEFVCTRDLTGAPGASAKGNIHSTLDRYTEWPPTGPDIKS
jgi:hypothetical protein